MKVFFILDKWCNGDRKYGASAWESNFVSTFKASGLGEFCIFHFDEFHDAHPFARLGDANKELLRQLKVERPDFIFLVIYRHPSETDLLIQVSTLIKIRDVLQTPIVTIFGDLEHPNQVSVMRSIEPYVSLILYTALAAPGIRLKLKKLHYSWVPKNENHFFDANLVRKYDVSYLGSPKRERIHLVDHLRSSGVDVWSGGGERNENISIDKYAQILNESKISLSFSRAERCHVTNARAFEVTACNSLLLEQAGMETPKIFRPFDEYIPFFSFKDCADKAKYFIRNERERNEIAANAHKKYLQQFSSKRFWMEIVNYVNEQKSGRYLNDDNLIYGHLSGQEFFLKPQMHVIAPTFSRLDYDRFPFFLQIYYLLLDKVMTNSLAYLIYRSCTQVFDFPERIVRKATRTFNQQFLRRLD
ncbi:glycosyltransferase family 1 protein [Polynucleobacter paneuropaeus]|nr:glycosyltransferase family 1 protein [Polynucleobacter paneuropaeus]MBT8587030.1 glycosyltransferase family 1 protein [Polynucleobacter paneuropaeus]MBT8599698.1 glycosyltransferase family 1 protein [Polynucleobacter paneuropaeus]